MEIEIDPNKPDQLARLEAAMLIHTIEVVPNDRGMLTARVRDVDAADQLKSTGQ